MPTQPAQLAHNIIMQFAGESIVTALACALHGFYLYSGFSQIVAAGISSLNDPLWNFFELRVGSGFPALPLTGPIFHPCPGFFRAWGSKDYTARGGASPPWLASWLRTIFMQRYSP